MDKALLAAQLRNRQYKLKHVSKKLIDIVSDDAIIDAYITCSCCGTKEFDQFQLLIIIARATDYVDFFNILDGKTKPHNCEKQ